MNALWHLSHVCGFSPVWVPCEWQSFQFKWVHSHKVDICMESLPHGFFYVLLDQIPDCIWNYKHHILRACFMCELSDVLWGCRTELMSYDRCNIGVSPLWICICTINWPGAVNALPHCVHLYGFPPVWVRMWTLRLSAWLHEYSQSSNLYATCMVFIILCPLSL